MVRLALLEAKTTLAPKQSKGGAESAEGAALQILPPTVPRFFICLDPIREQACKRIRNSLGQAGESQQPAERYGGPETQPFLRVPLQSIQLGNLFHIYHISRTDHSLLHLRHQVRPPSQNFAGQGLVFPKSSGLPAMNPVPGI